VNTIVTKTHQANSEMNRLSRMLNDARHPIIATLRLQLEDLRAKLKKVRHLAMEAISKLVVPDDLRIHVVDYAGVLPEYMTTKQTRCKVTRDPTERGIGSDEPPALAAQVSALSEACIDASAVMREIVSIVISTNENHEYDA
jgi:hypothetical protein